MLILPFFRDPAQARMWTFREWERLFQLARAARLMGTLAIFIRENGLSEFVPERGRWMLRSAEVKAERGRRQSLWESAQGQRSEAQNQGHL